MPRTLLTYSALLLAACLILAGPAQAEVSCEDMLCCVQASATGVECQDCQMGSPVQEQVSNGDSESVGCTCTLEGEAPVAETTEAIATFVRYELVSKELEVLELPLALLDVSEEKPVWYSTDEVPRYDFFLALSSFPNPPPAAA